MRRGIVGALTLLLATSALIVGEATPVAACSCAPPSPPAQQIGAADAAFVGRAVATRPIPDGAGDRFSDEWTFDVLRTYKGALGSTVEFVTHNDYDGDDGGDCGGANFRPGDVVVVLASLDGDGRLRASFGSCSPNAEESDLRARADLTPPSGSGPIAALVATRDRDATLIALNAARQVIGYGFGRGVPDAIVPCGDGLHFVTVESRWPHTMIVLWNAATLAARDVLTIRPNDQGISYGITSDMVGCTDPEHLVIASMEQEGDTDVVSAHGWRWHDETMIEFAPPDGWLTTIPGSTTAVIVDGTTLATFDPYRATPMQPIVDLPVASTVSLASVSLDRTRVLLAEGQAPGSDAIIVELASGATGSAIDLGERALRAAVWLDLEVVLAMFESDGDSWPAARIDLTTGTVAEVDLPGYWVSALDKGAFVVAGREYVGESSVVIEPDGSSSPFLAQTQYLRAALIFDGPEITPEAAAKLHADDIDFTQPAASIVVEGPTDGGATVVPIVGGATAGVGAVAFLRFRRRRRAASHH
jgi:hypothetical protein